MFEWMNEILWGVVVLFLILGTGVWLTLRTGFVQVRLFHCALREFWKRLRDRDSGFRALCTALAATVGTGNIAGIAGAIAIGGPGAVFWMWVSAFLGLAVKYAEGVLAVRYREQDGRAGPMYIIRRGLGERWRFLAYLYSFFGVIAAFGVGNATQVNAVLSALETTGASAGFGIAVGVLLAVVVARMVMGGAKYITSAAETLVPVVSGVYILLCLAAITMRWERAGEAVVDILRGAFDPQAVTGGAVGGMLTTMRLGVSRGTFTNEAGMGTAAIAHGGADVAHPARQGMMGIMEVFLDTMVICTLTALVILTGGVSIPYGGSAGAELTASALEAVFGGWVCALLCGCLVLFALATILGWGFYAGRCAEFLFGRINWKVFGLLQGAGVLLGVFLETGTVWTLAEIVNGLMAIPNLVALLLLNGEVVRLTREWEMCYNRSHRQRNARLSPMIEKEIGEIRRHTRRDRSNMTAIHGCFVSEGKEVISKFRLSTGMMPENEGEKYFALMKRVLSGSLGKNLIDITFRTQQVVDSPEHKLLTTLKDSQLKDEEALDSFYQKVMDSVTMDTAYLILIGCDAYDVPFKGKDDKVNADGSGEVYRYILCAVCPVKLSKATLEYKAEIKEFHDSAVTQLLSAPVLGFLFPAFDNRSTNLYNALLYSKDAGDNHEEFVSAIFNTQPYQTAKEQKQSFEALLGNALEEECSLDIVQAVHSEIGSMIQMHKESRVAEPLMLGKEEVKAVLQQSGVSEQALAKFSVDYDEAFGFETQLHPKNVIDQKHFEIKTPDVTIKVNPERSDLIETRVIGGVKYIMICADESVEVNGVSINIKEN